MEKVPAVPKVKREPRQLRDIRGPSREATDFTQGQYGILVSGTEPRAWRGGSPEGQAAAFGRLGQEVGRVEEAGEPRLVLSPLVGGENSKQTSNQRGPVPNWLQKGWTERAASVRRCLSFPSKGIRNVTLSLNRKSSSETSLVRPFLCQNRTGRGGRRRLLAQGRAGEPLSPSPH